MWRGRRPVLLLAALIGVLGAQGIAITQSDLWAAPFLAILFVATVTVIPLIPTLAVIFTIRILTDASLSSSSIRHTGDLNLSAGIAVLFILMALGLQLSRRQRVWPTLSMALWLCIWTGVAISTHGGSTETIREGVREAAIVALAVIVFNSRGVLTLNVVTRIIQLAGVASALIAIYQLATHTGVRIAGETRASGTFFHPDGAAMYFAIGATASLWQYFDNGRRRWDGLLALLFAAATLATFSLTGLASLIVMLMAFGALRPGALRRKVGSFALAILIVLAFLATPLGAERIANESSTNLGGGPTRSVTNTSLGWRFYKWRTLIPEWEASPILGQGLGTTVTAEGTSENLTAGKVPHNEYIRYLVETGVLGLATLLAGVCFLFRRLLRLRRCAQGPRNGPALGLAILLGCLFDALGDNTLLYSTTGFAAALILAAVVVAPTQSRASTPQATEA